MVLLRFTLSEEGVNALRDALACLNKFSDEVSLEAKRDKVCLLKCLALVYISTEPYEANSECF